MPQAPTNDDDLASRAQSLGINPAAPIQQLGQEADTENTRIHPYMLNPQLKCFEKYISQDWYESAEEYLNLKEASTIQLNDRVIYSLHQYLEDETVGKQLYRIACVDFADWDASVWTRVHPEVRKKFRKVMIQGGIMISNNGVPERLDEFIQEGLVAFEAEDPSKQNTNILAVASQKPPFSSSLFSPTRTTQTMTSRSIADDESHPIHPKLKNFERYVSRAWYDPEDIPLNLETATQIELDDRVICVLDQYVEDEISHNVLLRRVCEDFQEWDESIWNRVRKEVRMMFRKVLYVNGVGVDANLINDEDDTTDPSEEDYAANLPELASADRTDVGPLLDKTSSDSNKRKEKLPEEPASALPECVHFEEKQTSVPSQQNPAADLDDKPCVSLSMGRCTDLRENGDLDDERHEEERLAEPPDRQKIPADTRSIVPPVGKDPAAGKVSADPAQRRPKVLKRGCPTEAALDKDSVVDQTLVVLPDPPNLQRRRSSGGERPVKSPDDKYSPENTLPADPAVSKDLPAGVTLNDPPHGSKDHGEERTVNPDKERRVVDAFTNDSDSRINRADHISDEVSEFSFEEPLNNGVPVHSSVSRDENHTTFRHRDPARTPTDPPDGTGPQKQERKGEKTLPGEFALTGHCSLPSTGMTWTDRAERLTPPFLLTRALWSHFLRYSWNNYRLVERLVP